MKNLMDKLKLTRPKVYPAYSAVKNTNKNPYKISSYHYECAAIIASLAVTFLFMAIIAIFDVILLSAFVLALIPAAWNWRKAKKNDEILAFWTMKFEHQKCWGFICTVLFLFLIVVGLLVHFVVYYDLKEQDWIELSGDKCGVFTQIQLHDKEYQECEYEDGQKKCVDQHDFYYILAMTVEYKGVFYPGVGCYSGDRNANIISEENDGQHVFEYSTHNGMVKIPPWHCSCSHQYDDDACDNSDKCFIRFSGSGTTMIDSQRFVLEDSPSYVEVIKNNDYVYWNQIGFGFNVGLTFGLAASFLYITMRWFFLSALFLRNKSNETWERNYTSRLRKYHFSESKLAFILILAKKKRKRKKTILGKISPHIVREVYYYL